MLSRGKADGCANIDLTDEIRNTFYWNNLCNNFYNNNNNNNR